MPDWVAAFVVVAAVAIVIQTAVMAGIWLTLRDLHQRVTRSVSDMQHKVEPLLVRSAVILQQVESTIPGVLADCSEITRLARGQAQKVDRVLTDATDRMQVQVARADQVVSNALEVVEDAGTKIRKTVAGPLIEVNAILKGVQAGLDLIRGRRSNSSKSSRVSQDEELFI
jgi:hypothetical protein